MTFRSVCLAAASLSVLAGFASSALAAPAVTLTPVAGPPTVNVTVTGSGFGFFRPVDIYFDTVDVCLAISSGTGAVSCVIKVPKDTTPQNHWITALQRGGQGAQRIFIVRTDMPQFHGRNAAHSGVNPYENTLNVSNVADLDTLWQKSIGGGSFASPVVAGGRVYAAGADGKLYAFIAATGAPVAGFPVNASPAGNIMSGPAVGNGRVYVGGLDHKLHAYDKNTGAAVAGFPITLPNSIQAPPALALGNVYVGCNDGKVYGFNATTGVAVSGFPVTTSSQIFASPTIAGGRLYIGSNDHKIYGFNALNGTPIVGYPLITGGEIYGAVAAASGMGVAGSADSNIYGFHLASGFPLSGFPLLTAGPVLSSPAIAGGKVFTGSDDKVYAEFTGGSSAWTATLDSPIESSPMAANGVVYINSWSRLYALSAATGAILWSAAVEASTLNSPVVDDGIVYFASEYGNLYAFSLKGLPPASRLPGGAAGLRPNIATLKPDSALKPGQPALPPQVEE